MPVHIPEMGSCNPHARFIFVDFILVEVGGEEEEKEKERFRSGQPCTAVAPAYLGG